MISPSCRCQGSAPEFALECLSAGLSERNWCAAGRWTDPAGGWVPSISEVLLTKQKCAGPSHIFLGLRHRNVLDTCVFCEGFFNSIVLQFLCNQTHHNLIQSLLGPKFAVLAHIKFPLICQPQGDLSQHLTASFLPGALKLPVTP